jgi:hypothetical protein
LQFRLQFPLWTLLLIVVSSCVDAAAQCGVDQGCGYVILPNQQVQVASLPSVVAASRSQSDVMAASVATAVIDAAVCCGRDSALVDRVDLANGRSLMVLGEKLRGKHYLDSGLSIVVNDQYWPVASVHPEDIISSLVAQHPLLMVWSGHLYVVEGVLFDEWRCCNCAKTYVIKRLLLVDTRFSDQRRYVSFNRQTDDWSKVTELLALVITR